MPLLSLHTNHFFNVLEEQETKVYVRTGLWMSDEFLDWATQPHFKVSLNSVYLPPDVICVSRSSITDTHIPPDPNTS